MAKKKDTTVYTHISETVVVEEIEDKSNNLELDILKEKNREKELSIKELELRIKAYELGL